MSIDLEFDDAQGAIHDAVARFCADRWSEDHARAGDFPRDLWRELAELGVLALATPEGDGGAAEAVAALEALGAVVFPGPLAASFFASQLLSEPERIAVTTGARLVSVGTSPLMPWAPEAEIFLEVEDARVWRAEPRSDVAETHTLGGEPWGRVELARGDALEPAGRAHSLHDIAIAAYGAAAGRRLVDGAAEHARTRVQFGRAIGEFQAVAHPLADARIRLDSAQTLARAAACAFDDEPDSQATWAAAAAARLSARAAALEAAHVGHQVFGAVGISLEGPVFHLSRRIRQLASQPPTEALAHETVLSPLLQETA